MKNLFKNALGICLLAMAFTLFSSNSTYALDSDGDNKEYILLFRTAGMGDYQPTPEEFEAVNKKWQTWIGGIAANGQLVKTNQISEEAAVLHPDQKVERTAYKAADNTVGGYMIIKAKSIEEAIKIAKGCPVFDAGGTVEVRGIVTYEED